MATSNSPLPGIAAALPPPSPGAPVTPPRFQANVSAMSVKASLDHCVADVTISQMSPIDAFEHHQRWLCKRSFEFTTDEFELGLLLLALTSATESYFRSVLAASILTCPVAHEYNIDKGKFSMRAMSYYPMELIPLALLEHISFSDAEAIRKQTQELLQIEVPKTVKGASSIATALQDFDKVCALRHALIHSLGLVNSKNCTEAGFPNRSISRVSVTNAGFQTVADICLNVVRAYNQFVFDKLTTRLYDKAVLGPSADANEKILERLISVFVSNSSPDYKPDSKKMQAAIHSFFSSATQLPPTV